MVDDWRLLIQLIAAGTNLPEFLLVTAADSANYSSTLMQESPLVVHIEDIQNRLTPSVTRLASWISGVPPNQINIRWPSVIKRGIGELAGALGVAKQNGFISAQSGAERMGLRWDGTDGEKERITRETQEPADAMGLFAPRQAPSSTQKKVDGGVGQAPSGTSQGAGSGSEVRRGTTGGAVG